MQEVVVYVKLERNTLVRQPQVRMRDVAKISCKNGEIAAKVKSITIHRFKEQTPKRCVISVLKLIEMIEKECPQTRVESLGETDVLLELVSAKPEKRWKQWGKTAVVAAVSFFGTAFTIMAYHNDINIIGVFDQVYRIVMGREPKTVTVLEIAYSVGLGLGIIVFFNHLGGKRFTKDPTPIEVAMEQYRQDVEYTLIEKSDREGKRLDVD